MIKLNNYDAIKKLTDEIYEEVQAKIDIALGAPETDSEPVTVKLGDKGLVIVINRNGVAYGADREVIYQGHGEETINIAEETKEEPSQPPTDSLKEAYEDGKRAGQDSIVEGLTDRHYWDTNIYNNKEWVSEILETIVSANSLFYKDDQLDCPTTHLTSEKFWLDYIANNPEEIDEVGAAICKASLLYSNREVLNKALEDTKQKTEGYWICERCSSIADPDHDGEDLCNWCGLDHPVFKSKKGTEQTSPRSYKGYK